MNEKTAKLIRKFAKAIQMDARWGRKQIKNEWNLKSHREKGRMRRDMKQDSE